MPEMLFIVLMALVVFGPRRLPELARQFGKIMGEFKRASNEFQQQLTAEIDTLDQQERQQKIMPPAQEPSAPEGTVISSLMTPSAAPDESAEAPSYEPPPAEVRSTKITTPGGDLVPLPPPDPSKLSSFLRPAEVVPEEATMAQAAEQSSDQQVKGPNA